MSWRWLRPFEGDCGGYGLLTDDQDLRPGPSSGKVFREMPGLSIQALAEVILYSSGKNFDPKYGERTRLMEDIAQITKPRIGPLTAKSFKMPPAQLPLLPRPPRHQNR